MNFDQYLPKLVTLDILLIFHRFLEYRYFSIRTISLTYTIFLIHNLLKKKKNYSIFLFLFLNYLI